MKKLLLITTTLFFVFFTKTMVAQPSMGPKLGLGFSKITNIGGDADIKSAANTRMHLGVVFNFIGGKVFSFQPEILYMQKGFKMISTEEKNVFYKLNTNYFEIPAMFKFSFGSEKIKGFFDIGPYFAYWASAKNKYRDDPDENVQQEDYTFDNDDDMRLDVGLGFGGGVSYKLGPGKIVLDLRYDLGFLNIVQDPDDPCANRTFGISVMYLFNLKKQ